LSGASLDLREGLGNHQPMERSTSIVLNAPPQQVWDCIQDNATALDPAIVAFDVEPEPGAGAVNRITFQGPLGLRLKAVSRIEVWEPPHRYVAQSVKPSWPVRSRAEDVLDEEPDGTTRYTVSVSVQPRALAQPLGRLWLRYIISTREQMMSRLKTALESPSDATPEAPRRAGSRRRL
jgi:uncharacterized protein YndB with AHSA1/START domain